MAEWIHPFNRLSQLLGADLGGDGADETLMELACDEIERLRERTRRDETTEEAIATLRYWLDNALWTGEHGARDTTLWAAVERVVNYVNGIQKPK